MRSTRRSGKTKKTKAKKKQKRTERAARAGSGPSATSATSSTSAHSSASKRKRERERERHAAERDEPLPRFPVVGIGASAGGLEAVTSLLAHLPADTGMAFVLVQHLDPQQASFLPEQLRRATSMPVVEIREGLALRPNHVYVAPAAAVALRIDRLMHRLRRRRAHGERQRSLGALRSSARSRASRGARRLACSCPAWATMARRGLVPSTSKTA